jgi:hypothetical protein
MTTKLEEIEAEAMKLGGRARALLAQRLTLSLGKLSKREIETLWGEEAVRRSRELRDGRAKTVSGAAVLRKARASLSRKRSGSTR